MTASKYRSNVSKLREKLQTLETKKSENDNRYWKLGKDKGGNGMAIIRFLPEIDDGDMPVVKYFDHWFQNKDNGRWYKEMCPTSPTSGDKRCPVCESNKALWDGSEEDQAVAKERKRKLHYVSNVYIVDDPINPENNGKVFLFMYGETIYNRLMDKLNPKFDSEIPMNAFDLVEGAAFKLKGAKKAEKGKKEMYSYDGSEWLAPEDITVMDNIDEILDQRHSLIELVDPSLFKPYEELSDLLDKVLSGKVYKRKEELESDDDSEADLKEALKVAQAKKAAKKEKKPVVVEESEDEESLDDDDPDDAYMARLEQLAK